MNVEVVRAAHIKAAKDAQIVNKHLNQKIHLFSK
jgi:hypothetical protein